MKKAQWFDDELQRKLRHERERQKRDRDLEPPEDDDDGSDIDSLVQQVERRGE